MTRPAITVDELVKRLQQMPKNLPVKFATEGYATPLESIEICPPDFISDIAFVLLADETNAGCAVQPVSVMQESDYKQNKNITVKIELENLDKAQAAFAEMQKKYEVLLDESRCDRRHAVNRICMLESAVEDLQLENSRLEQTILNMKKPGGILHDG